ncbi:DUF2165 family protein [Novosphingobium sp. MW5]|nr:DUF2165 family protein [Novosphingobium sp. MW5]
MNLPIRYTKILLVFLTGLWAATSLFTNLGALEKTYGALEMVSSMRELGENSPPWKTSAPGVIWLGVACLLGGKLVTALLSWTGVRRMWKARDADSAAFQASKTLALLGGWSAVVWLFVGFAYFGEVIFFMYLGETGFNVAETAFRYAGYIGLMTLFVGQKDD